MGLSCCYRRRKNRRPLLPLYLRPSSPLPNHPSSSSSNLPIPVPRRPPPSSPPRNPPSSSSSTPPIPVPRPPPRTYAFTDPALYPPPIKVRPNNPPFNPYQNTKWAGSRPEALPPPPYVDLQSTVKLKHDVNVHKDTIRVDLDENNLNSYLVSFTFDALADGRLTGGGSCSVMVVAGLGGRRAAVGSVGGEEVALLAGVVVALELVVVWKANIS